MTDKTPTTDDTVQLPAAGRSTLHNQGRSMLQILDEAEMAREAREAEQAETAKADEPTDIDPDNADATETVAKIAERERILDEASDMLTAREKHLTGAEGDLMRVAAALGLVFNIPVSPEQAALALSAIQIARLAQRPAAVDGWQHVAANAAIGGEIARNSEAAL